MNEATHTPTFIGSFRSGTTLLVNLLGLHRDIAPWFETKALCEALRWLRVLRHPERAMFEGRHIIPPQPPGFSPTAVAERMRHDFRATADRISGRAPSGKMDHERYPIGYDCVLYSLAEAEAALDEWCAACFDRPEPQTAAAATGRLIHTLGNLQVRHAGKSWWANKTPGIPRFIPELWDCLGPCRMVVLIRDGREVVRSASHLGWASALEIARWWKVLIEEARAAAAVHPSYYLEMRYEDLIRNPESEVNRLLAFLGCKPEGELLVGDYRRRMGDDAFSTASRRLHPQEPDADWAAFDALAGDLMARLGYH